MELELETSHTRTYTLGYVHFGNSLLYWQHVKEKGKNIS